MSLCFELRMVLCYMQVVVGGGGGRGVGGGEEGSWGGGGFGASQLVRGISRMNTMNDVSKG